MTIKNVDVLRHQYALSYDFCCVEFLRLFVCLFACLLLVLPIVALLSSTIILLEFRATFVLNTDAVSLGGEKILKVCLPVGPVILHPT